MLDIHSYTETLRASGNPRGQVYKPPGRESFALRTYQRDRRMGKNDRGYRCPESFFEAECFRNCIKVARHPEKVRPTLLLLVGLTLFLSVVGLQAFNSSSRATVIVLPHARTVFLESPQVLASMANTGTSLPIWPQGSNLTFVSVTSTSLILTWTNATAVEYRIHENETLLNIVQGNLTSYYVTGLDSKAIYIFRVEAGNGTSWTLPLRLTVNPSTLTKQPLALSVPGPETVQAGTALTFTVNATGPNVPTETVSISASGLPAGATFPQASQGNPISATFAWSPTSSQGPGNYTITFQASDSLKSPLVTRAVLIHVTKARKAPVLSVPGPQTLAPGSLLSFAVVAEDPNLPPSPVTVSAAGLPNGSSFNSTTGVFLWITTCDYRSE